MKMPKTMMRYSPTLRKHTLHTVSQAKKRGRSQTHPMSRGSTGRMEKRGLRRGYGNHGKYSRPAIASFKMTGKKMTKRTDIRYTCSESKKTHVQGKSFRAKKIEFI